MKIRIAAALFALALPLCAQEPAAQAENLFYKAFYLEKGTRDFAGAMSLYEQFLAQAPDHKLAAEAAKQQFALLDKTGKTKERDAFKAKYGKLLGNAVATGGAPVAGDAPAGNRPPRGEGDRPARGEGDARGPGGRMDPAARIAELEKSIEKAKADGNEEEVKRLTAQLERAKQMGAGRAPGGQGGPGGGRAGIFGGKKLTEMTPEELTAFKDGMERMTGMLDRMRENLPEEQMKKLDASVEALKKNLADNKLEDAQKSLDEIRAAMPQRRRGGDAGGAGGGPAGGAGGGRGGNGGGGGGGR
jgi:hypothetical protein